MEQKFKTWALVELFGHTRIAGEVTEQTIAGGAMVRIDVPETEKSPAFTRIVNVQAIYAINPITEDMAKSIAEQISVKPLNAWDIRDYVDKNRKSLMSASDSDFQDLPL